MKIDKVPVDVSINIESLSVTREAFYNVCFITENDTAPRDLEVSKLKDLLDNGYDRFSLAYNFCVGVLAQQSMPVVYIRAKRVLETYEDAFSASSNENYYYLVIDSKDKTVVTNFNNYVNSTDDNKLLFYSTPESLTTGSSLAQYYQRSIAPEDLVGVNTVTIDNYYINKAYKLSNTVVGIDVATVGQLQQARLAYPESAWISLCGNKFPSSVQWLYKYLAKVDVVKDKEIPDGTTTTTLTLNRPATMGSGKTNQGEYIHEKVSFDWLKWALSRRVWNTLYTKEKINATEGGLDLLINDVKIVLDVALEQEMISSYKVLSASVNRQSNTVSIKFSAESTYTILNVEVSGSLSY